MTFKKNSFNNYGLGLGLRRDLRRATLDYIKDHDLIQWFEIVPENYISKGGIPKKHFQEVLDTKIPVIPHGVNLSIGTAPEPGSKASFDAVLLDQLEELFQEIKPPWFSDHISCTRIQGCYMQDLIPIPLTEQSLNVIADNIKYLQDRFQLPFLFENPSYYSTIIEAIIPEIDFMNAVLEKADCGMLLDVNNIYVNSTNHGKYSPEEYLAGLNLDRVVQVHIAGHHEDYTAWLSGKKLKILDTHGASIKTEVYEILKSLLKKTEIKAILLERDANFPELSQLVQELEYIRGITRHCKPSLQSALTSGNGSFASRDYAVNGYVEASRAQDDRGYRAPRNDVGLYQIQKEILNYFTGKESSLPAKTLDELSIYKSLILSSLEKLISKIHPLCYKILEKDWRKIIQLYYENFPSKSAIYNYAAKEFSKFLASKVFSDNFSYPNYLSELALYEWTSLEVYNAAENSKPKILELKFPITQIITYLTSTNDPIEEIQSTDIEEQDEFLLSFRDPKTLDSKFLALDKSSLFVAKALERNQEPEKIYIDLKENFAEAIKNQDEKLVRKAFDNLVGIFKNSDLLVK